MLDSGSVAGEKADEFTKKINVLRLFAKSIAEKDVVVAEAEEKAEADEVCQEERESAELPARYDAAAVFDSLLIFPLPLQSGTSTST